jgi:hypothetical protein
VTAPRPSWADEPPAPQSAQALFDEARTLMKAHDYARACPLFERSEALDPGGGTILNLAICHERAGKLAAAWNEMQLALLRAEQDQRADRIGTAKKHLAAMDAQLSRLVIQVSTPREHADMSILLDDVRVERKDWGTRLPIDPGPHQLRLSLPNGARKQISFVIGKAAEQRSIDVSLELGSASKLPLKTAKRLEAPTVTRPTLPTTARIEPPANSARPRWLGYSVMGGGVVAAGAGAYFALLARSLKQQSNASFDGEFCSNSACVSSWQRAQRSALAADAFLLVGAIALGTGLYLTFKPDRRPSIPSPMALSFRGFPGTALVTVDAAY